MLSPSGTSPASAAAVRHPPLAAKVVVWLSLALTLSAYGWCIKRGADRCREPNGSVRVALLSDTHVAGPEYPLGKGQALAVIAGRGSQTFNVHLLAMCPSNCSTAPLFRWGERRAGQRIHHSHAAAAVPRRSGHQRCAPAPAGGCSHFPLQQSGQGRAAMLRAPCCCCAHPC